MLGALMAVEPGAVIVVLMYGLCLYVVLYASRRVTGGEETLRPWWRRTRFWASFVAVVQIVVYAIWS